MYFVRILSYVTRRACTYQKYLWENTTTVKVMFPRKTFPFSVGFSIFTWLGFQEEEKEDELIMTIKRSILLIQRKELEKAEQLLHVGLRLAQQMQSHLGITYIYDIMANLALERNQLEKANKLFVSVMQRLMSEGVKDDDIKMIHISLKIARINALMKNYATAQLGFDWSLDKIKKNHDIYDKETAKKLTAMAYDWYARLYLDCNKTEDALDLLKESLSLSRETEDIDEEQIVIQLNDIATVCEKLNLIDESIQFLNEAVEIGKPLKDMGEYGAIFVNLGRLHMKKSLYKEARKFCGYGWRLGKERKNDEIKAQAMECIKEVNNISS